MIMYNRVIRCLFETGEIDNCILPECRYMVNGKTYHINFKLINNVYLTIPLKYLTKEINNVSKNDMEMLNS